MRNTTKTTFHTIVIGAGSGGLTAGIGLAKAGKSVLLVERNKMGGDCTNTGCVPSKALIHQASKANNTSKQQTDYIDTVADEAMLKVQETVNDFLLAEAPSEVEKYGVKVVLGNAQFINKNTVAVDGTTYTAKYIIISSGSHPRLLNTPGIEDASNIHTSDTIFTLTTIPKRLLVIGSGPIGMELGQAFSLLGADVTLATTDNTLAKLEEPEVSSLLQDSFKTSDIKFIGNAHITKFLDSNTAVFDIKNGDVAIETLQVEYDTVLLSIGREPNTDLNLETAGIKYSTQGISVNKRWRTSQNNIFAIGDVSDKFKFTHTADDAARNVIKQILIPLPIFSKRRVIPKVTYTKPELAQVGLTYAAAVSKYNEAEILKLTVPFDEDVDRAKIDHSNGVLIIIAKRLTGKIIGAHIAHARAGDMISFFTLAIKSKVTMWKLNNMMFPYPSYSLSTKKASDMFLTQTLSTYKSDLLYLVRKHGIKLFALLFWILLLYTFNSYKAAHGLDSKELSIILANFITGTFWGPLIFMLFYIFRPLILFPAVLLTTLSGVIFGFWGGFIYTLIGENISASFVYLIGRFFGKGIHLEDTLLGPMITKIKNEPFMSILIARFLFFPFDLTNLACGAIRARWRSYAAATVIGVIPGMSTFIALGASFENVAEFDLSMLHINPMTLLFSVILFLFSLILAKLLKKYTKH